MNVFCYGSLMFSEVWNRIVKGSYPSKLGLVKGYERRKVKGVTYPCLIKNNDRKKVEGVIYFDVDKQDLLKLDQFEGAEYERIGEVAYLKNGGCVEVELYLWRNKYLNLVETEQWDVQWFETVGISLFLNRYQGFIE